MRRVTISEHVGGIRVASKPMSDISWGGVGSVTAVIVKGDVFTLISLSVVQTIGSYSITPRSARRATVMEYIPCFVLSIPSIDCRSLAMEFRVDCILIPPHKIHMSSPLFATRMFGDQD